MRDFEEGKDTRRAGGAGVLIFGGNEDWSGWCKWMLQEFIDGYLMKQPPPPVRSDHHQSDIIKDTLTEQNTRPEKHLFSTQPAVPHIRQRKHTHTHIFSFQGDELFQWHSFREAQLTLRMIHQHRPRVKSNARRHHVRRGGCRGGGDLHRNNHIFQSERPLDQNYTEDWSCQSKTHVKKYINKLIKKLNCH